MAGETRMSTLKVDTITDSSSGLTTTINGFTPNIGNMRGRNLVINGHMLIIPLIFLFNNLQ
jgi:hypothetical protein